MRLKNKRELSESYERWDLTTENHHNFIVCGCVAHNSNSRFVFIDDQMFYGSRAEWKKEFPSPPQATYEQLLEQIKDEVKARMVFEKLQNWKPVKNAWWKVSEMTPGIEFFCKSYPGYCLYGELYGHNKGFPYDTTPESGAKFRAFDILKPDGTWMDFPEYLEMVRTYSVPYCPVIHEAYPFNFDDMVKMGEGNSTLAGHIREGVVVHPVKERWDERIGRVKLKIINPEY